MPSTTGRAAIPCLVVVAAALVCGRGVGADEPVAAGPSAVDRAAELRAAGRLDDALEALRAESRDIKKAEGEQSPRLLPINELAADILIDKGDAATAASLLDKTIAAREKLVASGHRENVVPLGRSLVSLARVKSAARQLPEAVAVSRRALVMLDGAPERDTAAIGRARDSLEQAVEAVEAVLGAGAEGTRKVRDDAAVAFTAAGMYREAIGQRRRILEGILARQGPDATDVVAATDRLVRLMMMAGHADEATGIIERSLGVLEPSRPPDMLRLLGDAQAAADRLALAEGSYAQALEAAQGEEKPAAVTLAADRLRGLVVDLRRGVAGRLPEWFDAAARSLARPLPTEVDRAITGLILAGIVHEEMGKPATAAESFGRALGLATAVRAPDAAVVADLSGRLVAAQLATGDATAARKTAEKALAEAERDLGPGDGRVGFLRILLAAALERGGQADKAVALAGRALDRGLPRPDDDWEQQATAIYDRLATGAGGADLRERYIATRARQFGETHRHVAAACAMFGAARLAAGDGPAAVALFRRALDVHRSGGGDDPESAASLVLLALAEDVSGEAKRAVETATLGLAAWERAAGADHPGSLSAAEVLVAAKVRSGDVSGVVALLERLCAADATADPAVRAAHLVRLADMTATRDKARAQALLRQAMQLPCWQEGAARGPAARRRLAFTAALAAHAFTAVGDPAAATAAVQRARGLVLEAADPKPLLDRIESIAARGDLPVGRP